MNKLTVDQVAALLVSSFQMWTGCEAIEAVRYATTFVKYGDFRITLGSGIIISAACENDDHSGMARYSVCLNWSARGEQSLTDSETYFGYMQAALQTAKMIEQSIDNMMRMATGCCDEPALVAAIAALR